MSKSKEDIDTVEEPEQEQSQQESNQEGSEFASRSGAGEGEEESEEVMVNGHDLVGVEGILKRQKSEVDKKKL